jgi:hypothetical protein
MVGCRVRVNTGTALSLAGVGRTLTGWLVQRVMASTAAGGGGERTVTKVDPNKAAGGEKKKIDTQPPRGTRDFLPEDMRLRNWLFGHFRQVCRRGVSRERTLA